MKHIHGKNHVLYIFNVITALGIALFFGACADYGPTTHAYNVPEITLLGNAIDTIPAGVKYIDSGATVTDVEDGDLTNKLVVNYGTLDTANPVVGPYTITYSVTDSKGIKVSMNRTVLVVNFPVITLLGKEVDTIPRRVKYVDSGATAIDVEDGDLTGTIAVDHDTLNLISPVMGTYTITYTITDSDGYTSTANRTVIVLNLPVITLFGKEVDTVQAGVKYVDSGATAFDFDDGDLTSEIVIDYGDLDTANPVEGSYTITYSVTNSDNKTNTANRTVVVVTLLQQDTTKISELLNTISLFDDTNTVYLVPQNLTVPDGYSLTFGKRVVIIVEEPIVINGSFTVEGGVQFLMAEETYMVVNTGILSINGTATDTVFFKNYTADIYWGSDGSTSGNSYALLFSQNANATSSVNFCVIDSGTTGINVQKDGIVITNSTVKNSKYAGMYFYQCGPKDSVSFVNNYFIRNGSTSSFYPLEINVEYLHRLPGTAAFSANSAQAILVESGTAKSNGTWRKHTVPYVFDGGAVINNTDGVTITIEPGTVLQFKQNAYLTVNAATLIASASSAAPITFSSYKSGQYWGNDGSASSSSYGIQFTANANANSILNYCMIDSGTTGINVKKDGIVITNSTIKNSKYAGMYYYQCGPKDSVSFVNNNFIGNGSTSSFYPLEINVEYLHRLSGTATFTDNSAQTILVESGTAKNKGTWRKHTVPYVFDGGAVINNTDGVTITIEPGTVLQFKQNAYLTVDAATLIASATAAAPITFSSYKSGQYWGNDGSASSSSYGIQFTANANANSILNYCMIDSGTTGINVKKDGIVITNSTIKNSKYAGMYYYQCGPKDSVSFVNNNFIGNGSTSSFYPLEINVEYLHRLSGITTFTDNYTQAILVESGIAKNNGTWRKHTVPYVFNGETVIANTNGVTITIEPGTVLQFKRNAYLSVDAATLIASATAAYPITFSNYVPGQHWGRNGNNSSNSYGIHFTANANANSVLNYCMIDSGTTGINVKKDGISISNTTVQYCLYAGMYFSECGPKDSITYVNNSFIGNSSTNSFYPLHLSAEYLHRLSGSLLFTNNTNNAIFVDTATVTASGSWKKQTVPYVFNTGEVVIDNTNGVQVTINPGAIFKFFTTSTIQVDNGTFIANGTASETITFTNWIQGQYWGADEGAGYDSYGILFTDKTNANSSVSYCSFSNATQAVNSRNSPVTISNSTISDCKYYGLYSKGTGNANIDTVSITFTGNGLGDYLHEVR